MIVVLAVFFTWATLKILDWLIDASCLGSFAQQVASYIMKCLRPSEMHWYGDAGRQWRFVTDYELVAITAVIVCSQKQRWKADPSISVSHCTDVFIAMAWNSSNSTRILTLRWESGSGALSDGTTRVCSTTSLELALQTARVAGSCNECQGSCIRYGTYFKQTWITIANFHRRYVHTTKIMATEQ